MNTKTKIQIGDKFDKLTVIHRVENDKYNAPKWLCKCDCGNESIVRGGALKAKRIRSCGCKRKESCSTHGLYNTKLYGVWQGIKERCCNNNNKNYKYYGARGINICQEWLNNFKEFYEWAIDNGYKQDLTIDRIDNNGSYKPSNCRFVSRSIQSKNRRPFNKTGVKYVYMNGQSYKVEKQVDGKLKHFGTYKTLEEAKIVVGKISEVD